MMISINVNKLYEEVETMWQQTPQLAELLLKTLEVVQQEKQ